MELKHTVLLLAIIKSTFLCFIGHSQTPIFTWVQGPNAIDQPGVYGTPTLFSSANQPGARENAMSWTDQNGKFWLFGGHGLNTTTSQGFLNDLWMFDPVIGQWTFMHGTQGLGNSGVYGTLGVSASGNIPASRQNGATWVDVNGNLWLFGGQTVGTNSFLNDLWKYNITANQWTWMSGSNTSGQPSNFGSLNVSSGTNVPGARFGALAWVSNSNELFLFGGQEYNGVQERSNDLWKYSISTGQWVWVSGSNLADQNGVYGTLGVEAISNVPGARQASVTWKDNSGKFWMFGGYGFPLSGSHGYLNDLWKYDPSTNKWTWISGSNATSQVGNYGTLGVATALTVPGARQMSVSWVDNTGKFWLFGGWGHLSIGVFGHLNDLWSYDTAANNWTWESGANAIDQTGSYGVLGSASVSNIPGSRRMAVSWSGSDGSLWMFGGHGLGTASTFGLLSDLWKIEGTGTNNLDQKQSTDLSVYPNPSNGNIRIENPATEKKMISVVDVEGREVFSFEINPGQNTIDLSFLENGLFLITNGQGNLHRLILGHD